MEYEPKDIKSFHRRRAGFLCEHEDTAGVASRDSKLLVKVGREQPRLGICVAYRNF